MELNARIYVAGSTGMVGSAIIRNLQQRGYTNIITSSSKNLDLRDQQAVFAFFEKEKPEYVFLAAAKVGGIMANNTYRGEFIYDNLMIEANIIHAAYINKVTKLLFLGSTCIYPKLAPQPMDEKVLLTGPLEPTNQPYAIAKIAGIELCNAYRAQYGCNFIAVMPTNLYGPNDNYDPQGSHVLPALIRRIHEAKINNIQEVTIWGTGAPKREFLHADDLADACVYLMLHYNDPELVNIGVGEDLSILELAHTIADIIGYKGSISTDPSKPDGTPRKLLNVDKLHSLGWRAKIHLRDGIEKAYQDYLMKYAGNNATMA